MIHRRSVTGYDDQNIFRQRLSHSSESRSTPWRVKSTWVLFVEALSAAPREIRRGVQSEVSVCGDGRVLKPTVVLTSVPTARGELTPSQSPACSWRKEPAWHTAELTAYRFRNAPTTTSVSPLSQSQLKQLASIQRQTAVRVMALIGTKSHLSLAKLIVQPSTW